MLPVEATERYYWGGVIFNLYVSRELTTEETTELERLRISWYQIGTRSGYEGLIHYATEATYDYESSNLRLSWTVDMGSSSALALEVLVRCLTYLKDECEFPFERLVLGEISQ